MHQRRNVLAHSWAIILCGCVRQAQWLCYTHQTPPKKREHNNNTQGQEWTIDSGWFDVTLVVVHTAVDDDGGGGSVLWLCDIMHALYNVEFIEDVLDLVRVRVFVAVCCAGDGLPPLVLISAWTYRFMYMYMYTFCGAYTCRRYMRYNIILCQTCACECCVATPFRISIIRVKRSQWPRARTRVQAILRTKFGSAGGEGGELIIQTVYSMCRAEYASL